MARVPRPLSPHLQIYRWQLTSVMSMLHRISGVTLVGGTLLLTWWLVAAVEGPEEFEVVQGVIGSWYGQAVLLGFTLALFYHLCNGIRHLVWDLGLGLELDSVYRSGRAVIIATVLLTVLSWMVGYAMKGG
ncbi:MAG: succinate dehydrogenase, cytochrome b556 subunit [Alphaproteobacteria bacterium]|nr:succinate dehydrogenase, cytochrome b556 subunit [Alphaproteobacteria bacterium]